MPGKLLVVFLALLSLSASLLSASSSPFSTVAIARVSDVTLVCALVPSPAASGGRYNLSCTSTSCWRQRSYGSGGEYGYAAVAAGDGFLCGLTEPDDEGNVTMRWWGFPDRGSEVYEKRIYQGTALAALVAGDTHVCSLIGSVRRPQCWRWPGLVVPAGVNFSEIAVGGNFLCGLLDGAGALRCFGSDAAVVEKVPPGNFSMVAAGTRHACGVHDDGNLTCWGKDAPELGEASLDVVSMALGENRTCVLQSNGIVLCWGEGARPPDNLAGEQFIAIQARGELICGVMMVNYSLVCWGNELLRRNHTVYGRVLPGACSPLESCACGVLPGSGDLCPPGDEGICQSCKLKISPVTPNDSPPSGVPIGSHRSKRRVLLQILGSLGLGIGFMVLLSFLVFSVLKKRRNGSVQDTVWPWPAARPSKGEESSDCLQGGGIIEEFSIWCLLKVTHNFSEAHKIGSGSFGAVYRATLPGGHEVAIKRAELPAAAASSTSRRHEQIRLRDKQQRERAFCSELDLLSRINHKNLVRLLGFCTEQGERVLVYEYMANGTLHDHLHRRPMSPSSPLGSWPARLRVALDAARGVEYLHSYAVPAIIHRDIKSSNILLDAEWTAKVADFGLSLTSPDDEGSIAAGTVGYMDPEYYRLRRLTEKSDVYSFGVVLLELVTGCKAVHRSQELELGAADEEEGDQGSTTPRNVVEMAVPWIETDDVARVMDRRVTAASAEEGAAVAYVGYVAAECVRPEGRDRPSMGDVVGALERAVAACSRATPDRGLSRAQCVV